MKSILFYLLFITSTSFGQNATIAKLKFEQAEQAYNEGRYQESLDYISEVETLLKGTNTRTLYLKIVAQDKKLANLESATFNDIATLRKNCDSYLKTTDGKVELEDKFKEVYFVTERIKNFPTNQLDFEKFKAQLIEKQQKEKTEKQMISIAGINLGMKMDDIPLNIWNSIDRQGYNYENGNRSFTNHTRKMDFASFVVAVSNPNSTGLNSITIDRTTQTVFALTQTLVSGNKLNQAAILQDFTNKIQELNKEHGEINVVRSESEQKAGRVKTLTKNATVTINKKMVYTISYIVSTSGLAVSVLLTESISFID